MIKRLLISSILILWAMPSFAQWAVPGSQVATGQSTDTFNASAVTGAITTTSSAHLMFAVVARDLSCTTPGIVDSKSNNWVLLGTIGPVSSNAVDIFEATSNALAVGSGHTFTPNPTGCTSNHSYASIIVQVVNNSGSTNGMNVDQVPVSAGATSTPVAAGSYTPTTGNQIVFAAAGMAVASGTWGATPSGFTLSAALNQVNGLAYGVTLAYQIQTSATTVNPSFAYTGSGPTEAITSSFRNQYPIHPNLTASSCNFFDVNNALSLVLSGDTLTIPSGSCTWTSGITMNLPTNFTIKGNTVCTGSGNPAQNNLACTDNTTILDDINRSSLDFPLIDWNTGSGSFRMTGITFGDGGGGTSANGVIRFEIQTSNFRVDHTHFNGLHNVGVKTYLSKGGVFDHVLFDGSGRSSANDIQQYGDFGNQGNTDWALATGRGTGNYTYIEDSSFVNSFYVNDCLFGGKFVFRFNSFTNTTDALQTHPTQNVYRGCRAWEIYGNNIVGNGGVNFNVFFVSSGSGVIWNNTNTSGLFSNFITAHELRRDNSVYMQLPTPNGWGYCGTSFDGTGSNWDQNTSATTGYRCLDAPGTGKTDLLTGAMPTLINSFNGCDSSMSCAWPHQASEPIYEWSNVWTNPGGGGSFFANYNSDAIAQNTDYYLNSNPAAANCTGFTGATGVGCGLRSARPSTCTTGVAYFSADQGNWNAGNLGTGITIGGTTYYNGVLDVCTSTNTWTNAVYTPYTYPNPLTTGGGGSIFTYAAPINFTSSSTQIPASQSNFPYVTKVTVNHSHVDNSSGFDIRPYADSTCSTTPLEYQLISYNNTSGALVMWINGTISAGGQAWLCYGASSLTTDGSNTTTSGTFPGYSVRIHGGDGSTVSLTDVSGNSLNGTNGTPTNQMLAASGEIVGGFGANQSNFEYAFISGTSSIVTGSTLSMGTWLKGTVAVPTSNLGGVWEKSNGSTYDYMLYWNGNTGDLRFYVVNNSATPVNVTSSVNYKDGNWHKVKGTWDGTNMRLYIDGALAAGPTSQTGTLQNSSGSRMGWVNDYLQTLDVNTDAVFEESLVRPTVDSANWEASEYYNEVSGSTFLSLGSEVPLSSTGTGSRGRMRQP